MRTSIAKGRGLSDLLFGAALLAGSSYVFARSGLPWPAQVAWKGAGVTLLALWVIARSRSSAARAMAAALALGATGDMLIEVGLVPGAMAFLAGHVVAAVVYFRNRRAPPILAVPVAVAIALAAWWLPTDRAAAPGVALYAFGLGGMVGLALASRYPRALVGLGAGLFAASDLLLFARMGPLAGSALPDFLVWPLYFAGQTLIAIGVVRTEAR